MKRNFILLAASLFLLCGTVSASATPAAGTVSTVSATAFEQEVRVTRFKGSLQEIWTCTVTASDNACSSYTISFGSRSYRVLKSDKEGYRYMFYDYNGYACYFNM